MNFNTNLNRNFFKKFANANAINNESVTEPLFEEFAEECARIAKEDLMLASGYTTPEADMFNLQDFIYDYLLKNLNNSNANSSNIKLLLEKYILDTVYGKGRMNNKFNMKHKGTPAQKVAMLERIHKQMHSPNNWGPNGFNWGNLNDPDYYNMKTLSWYGYENGYYESLNGRINNYRRKMASSTNLVAKRAYLKKSLNATKSEAKKETLRKKIAELNKQISGNK